MKHSHLFLVASTIALVATSCTSSNREASEGANTASQTKDAPSWAGRMQALSKTLSELFPLVVSRAKFQDEKNFETIERNTIELKNLAQGIHAQAVKSPPNADPVLKKASEIFEDDIVRALDGLRSGNRDYARHILRNATSYCIQCHTQTDQGPSFPLLNLGVEPASLPPLPRAEFFAATRQFDRSLAAYEEALSSEEFAKSNPFEWEEAARTALAIITRVKNDPKEAAAFLSKIETHPILPASTKQALVSWKKSVREWQAELGKKKPSQKPLSPAQKVTQARTMIERARKRQEFPMDASQDLLYFRASSLLHGALEEPDSKADIRAEALYLAGLAAEATRDMNLWTLHESYFEQCIQTQPHSRQAQRCFDSLKESITLGYSGSSGVHIPAEETRRLEKFRRLADPHDGGSETPPPTSP